MKLLMDKALYPDPALFLRELLQNALDACRIQEALVKQHNKIDDDVFTYAPHIAVFDHSEEAENPRIIFQDNGIGMSEEIVRNYFLRVGKSYYRSNDFKTQQYKLKTDYNIQLDACSNFGIGFLSCFLVGDK
ncbi:hypothetical protein EMN47_21510, partial [Prolixibacteraceae bacterium JC049]|nr:hypothetical protein [Prolixibacteraceae bacterium JC049]